MSIITKYFFQNYFVDFHCSKKMLRKFAYKFMERQRLDFSLFYML